MLNNPERSNESLVEEYSKLRGVADQNDIINATLADSGTYAYDRTSAGVLRVFPALEYLSRFRRGGPILGGEGRNLRPGFPVLAFKVVNNTPDTLYLSELVISVQKSAVNTEPVLRVLKETVNELVLVNEGWGTVLNPSIHFRMIAAERCEDLDPTLAIKTHTLNLATFDRDTTVDLGSLWSATNPRPAVRRLEAGELVCVYGVFKYSSERGDTHSVTFKTSVFMGMPEYRYGAAMSFAHLGVIFIEAGKQQVIRRPLAHYIKSREVEHLGVILVITKSAFTQLEVSFAALGGQVPPKTIEIETFVPRQVAGQLEPSQAPGGGPYSVRRKLPSWQLEILKEEDKPSRKPAPK